MAFTALDKQLIQSGLFRASGSSGPNQLFELAATFFQLGAQAQENQIRNEALLEYNEMLSDIANLQAKVVQLQAQSVILQNRSVGNQ